MDCRTMAVGLIIGTGALGGCVSQQAYDDTERSARTFEARNQELLDQNAQLEAMVGAKDQRIRELEREKAGLEDRIGTLSGDLRSVRGTVTELDQQLQGLRFGAVDPVTDRALRRLAQRHPGLIQYDASLGMLRFGSDLTFASGSDELKAGAEASLRELAQILQGIDAEGYDVHVIGHTDNQPVGKSRARHPSNRHLSAHRAISVARALQSAGIPGDRILVAGWGDQRPAVPNNPSGGTPANRRVEIYLVASTADASLSVDAMSGERATPAEDRRRAPMK